MTSKFTGSGFDLNIYGLVVISLLHWQSVVVRAPGLE